LAHRPRNSPQHQAVDKWTARAALEPAGLPWTTLRVAHRASLCPLDHSLRLRLSKCLQSRSQKTQIRRYKGLGFALGMSGDFDLAQALRHPSLPTWPCGSPTRHDLGWQSQRNKLPRVRRTWTATLVDGRASEHFISEFRKLLVLGARDAMGIHASEVRLRGTVRDGLAHGYWPSAY
jgi:hypothetical protein